MLSQSYYSDATRPQSPTGWPSIHGYSVWNFPKDSAKMQTRGLKNQTNQLCFMPWGIHIQKVLPVRVILSARSRSSVLQYFSVILAGTGTERPFSWFWGSVLRSLSVYPPETKSRESYQVVTTVLWLFGAQRARLPAGMEWTADLIGDFPRSLFLSLILFFFLSLILTIFHSIGDLGPPRRSPGSRARNYSTQMPMAALGNLCPMGEK